MRFVLAMILAFSVSVHAASSPGGPPPDNSTHEFIMSCTYGVLAGTLVGAASLAFTDEPGQNLNIVARGASLGLYAGILLGLYVVYVVPALEANPDEEPVALLDRIPMINPIFRYNSNQIDGWKADWTVMRF